MRAAVLMMLFSTVALADFQYSVPVFEDITASSTPTPAPQRKAKKELPSLSINKPLAELTITYPNGDVIKTPVLLGKIRSDLNDPQQYNSRQPANYITPAGDFTVKKMFSWHLNEPMLVFIEGNNAVASIHPLWMSNPNQKRVQRLASPTPTDNRITGGCVNVDSKFFYDVLINIPDGSPLHISKESP